MEKKTENNAQRILLGRFLEHLTNHLTIECNKLEEYLNANEGQIEKMQSEKKLLLLNITQSLPPKGSFYVKRANKDIETKTKKFKEFLTNIEEKKHLYQENCESWLKSVETQHMERFSFDTITTANFDEVEKESNYQIQEITKLTNKIKIKIKNGKARSCAILAKCEEEQNLLHTLISIEKELQENLKRHAPKPFKPLNLLKLKPITKPVNIDELLKEIAGLKIQLAKLKQKKIY